MEKYIQQVSFWFRFLGSLGFLLSGDIYIYYFLVIDVEKLMYVVDDKDIVNDHIAVLCTAK